MCPRRQKQIAYNKKYGIIPKTIFREIAPSLAPVELDETLEVLEEMPILETVINFDEKIFELEEKMRIAAELRDRISVLKKKKQL